MSNDDLIWAAVMAERDEARARVACDPLPTGGCGTCLACVDARRRKAERERDEARSWERTNKMAAEAYAARLAATEARVAALEGALRPFAGLYQETELFARRDSDPLYAVGFSEPITVGDVRRARRVLDGEEDCPRCVGRPCSCVRAIDHARRALDWEGT